jgi:hypothetical protein
MVEEFLQDGIGDSSDTRAEESSVKYIVSSDVTVPTPKREDMEMRDLLASITLSFPRLRRSS